MTNREKIIDTLHRYRRGEIKLADDAADEILKAVGLRENEALRDRAPNR